MNFRIPSELLDRIKAAADENNRTITAELVSRLEASFEDLPELGPLVREEVAQQIKTSNQQILELLQTHAKNIELAVRHAEANPAQSRAKRTKEK
ncbi:Arc family DNA-binding protein [Xanthomonas campestris]|uniref:Arc family DNA-binding protein n=1 Tax=Xanthomonas campestris TaxID=339 RepID=UPI0023685044|nr:Arc family DNA-binding protein [Xanthomonas campestris]WDI91919.1 Arc family DNA-binding protein [Xanthomonas campestris]